jgi:hypothetical protein
MIFHSGKIEPSLIYIERKRWIELLGTAPDGGQQQTRREADENPNCDRHPCIIASRGSGA